MHKRSVEAFRNFAHLKLTYPDTFEQLIRDNLLEQPVSKLKHPKLRTFLRQNIIQFLVNKTLRLEKACGLLPIIIGDAAAAFVEIDSPGLTNPIAKYKAKKQFVIDIVKAIVAVRGDQIRSFIITPPKTLHVQTINDHLAIAIMIRRQDIVTRLLGQGANPLKSSKALGDPLCLMVKLNKSAMTSVILAAVQSQFSTSVAPTQQNRVVGKLIVWALETHGEAVASSLYTWYRQIAQGFAAQVSIFGGCMKHSASELARDILQTTLPKRGLKALRKAAISSIVYNHMPPAILSVCIEEKLLNTLDSYESPFPRDPPFTLIRKAVEKDNVQMAKIILDAHDQAGHTMNNSSPFSSNNSTLRLAIRKNSFEMVKLLLEKEFDPEGGVSKEDPSTFELAYCGSRVQGIVKEAVLAQREQFGEDYTPPVRQVWNEDLQEVELIAYILAPGHEDE
jgi:hypothetical protein